ncbi:LAQU0S02e02938g1_1 [Lachancea quebecensis]|uniref:LAQU0S02e02938g1_1 n=1 Tax=Lachancea quebecensis TaxID=1654605 RepID=A0A0P1KW36_9SACH|nr:LAQU0S02e02938g1_1 [Lachancea quebecensis]
MSRIEELESDSEENYSTKSSQVFLGFVDAAIKESDKVTVEDSFIGGEPIWLHPDSVPEKELLKCGACKSQDNMKLILQAFAPLDPEQVEDAINKTNLQSSAPRNVNSSDERVLYVFTCTKCSRKPNSVRCIRGVKKSAVDGALGATMKDRGTEKNFSINPFDLSQNATNPFSSVSNGKTDANPFTQPSPDPFESIPKNTDAPAEEINNPKNARKQHDALPDKKFEGKFPGFFLYVDEESFKNKTPDHLKLPKNLKIDKTAFEFSEEDDKSIVKSPVSLDPRTEKLSKFLDDDVFQKFQEIVGYNPLQVLRYDFGGKPLYYSATNVDLEKIVPPPGWNPSSKRVFELQLMPKMIMDLEVTVSVTEGMEWGTILVFTDVENYMPKFDEHGVGYVEECVRVQWESDK